MSPDIEAHGARIPRIGFGTGGLRGDEGAAIILEALGAGYRHLDTARSYGNERQVGHAVRASGLHRDEVFVTTKVWPDRLASDDLRRSAEESVEALGLGAVDLLLIHWPNPSIALADTIGALNRVRRDGLARNIGVSNFTRALLREAWSVTGEPLVANQCEYHPLLDQRELVKECRSFGTAFIAYMPLGRAAALDLPAIKAVARAHGRTPAQVILRWLMQQDGVAAVPKSTNAQRMRSNLSIFDFALTAPEMAAIVGLARADGRLVRFPRIRRIDGGFDDFPDLEPQWDR